MTLHHTGIQMLGVPDGLEDETIREAFCFGAGIKNKVHMTHFI